MRLIDASAIPRLIRIGLLTVAVVACSPVANLTAVPASEMLPGPGYFHIVGDPEFADASLTFRYIGSDGEVADVSDTIQPGERTVVDRTTLPGTQEISVNGLTCSGSFPVESDRETDLVVRITADGCEVRIIQIHGADDVTH